MAISANATVTINVRTTTGDAPYLYTWGGASNGEWPGTLMDETQTSVTEDGLVWLTQEFDCDAINIIFNDGGLDDEGTGAIQTDNILGVTGTAYFIFDPEEGEFEDVTGTYVEIHEFDPSTLPAGVVWPLLLGQNAMCGLGTKPPAQISHKQVQMGGLVTPSL